jgi:hypothetical protein
MSQRFQSFDTAIVDGMLQGLLDNGLLIAEEELLRAEKSSAGSSRAVTSTYFPTRNRPDLVLRSVRSHARSIGHRTAFRVVDDSDPGQARTLKHALREVRQRHPVSVSIASRDEKARYLKHLRERLQPDRELSLALDTVLGDPFALPQRIGVNRNWVLLDSVGDLILSADDDTVASVTFPEGARSGLSLSSVEDPTSVRRYESIDSVTSSREFASADLVSEHARLLGVSVHEVLVATESERVSVESMTPSFVQRLLSVRAGVSVTALGQAGDPGRAGLGFLLKRDRSIPDPYLDDRESLMRALTASTVVRHAPEATISDASFFMSTHFGLDHRSLVPPLFPVGHNDDGVFAEMLLALAPGSTIGHIPVAIHHEPPAIRSVTLEAVRHVTPSLSTFVGMFFHEFRPLLGVERVEHAFRRAGALFRSAGELHPDAFRNLIRSHWTRFLARQMNEYLAVLDRHDRSPDFWAEEVDAVVAGIERQLSAQSFPIPVELADHPSREKPIELTRRLFRDYGAVLAAWPEIWAAARSLKDDSIRPTVDIETAVSDEQG